LDVLAFLPPTSTSADRTLEHAIAFVLRHRRTRAARLPVVDEAGGSETPLDLALDTRRVVESGDGTTPT
jgi:hypothetical protein